MRFFLLSIFALSLGGCTEPPSNENRRAVGKLSEHKLEEGQWEFFDSTGKLIEYGKFENGLRSGAWNYNYGQIGRIFWKPAEIPHLEMKLSLPDSMSMTDKDENFVEFKFNSVDKKIRVFISQVQKVEVDVYKADLFALLTQRNFRILDSSSNLKESNNGTRFVFQRLQLIDSLQNPLFVYNVVRYTEKEEGWEFSVTGDFKWEELGRKLFYSVLPNLFISNERFVDPSSSLIE